MRRYVIVSGSIFGLIVLAHIARAVAEGWTTATAPVFVVTTALSGGLALWAFAVLRKQGRR